MSWYNYVFAVVAFILMASPILVGMLVYASQKNGYGMAATLLLAAFWAGVFYWNVYA